MSGLACAVAIMAKASIAGTVKTRLVPPLTHAEAAELNTCCLADVAANVIAAADEAPIQGFAAYHPPGSEGFFAGNRKFITRRLWGFANVPPFFHHAQFSTVRQAVLAHSGEALASRQ